MPFYPENFGLGFITQDKSTIFGLMRHVAQEGKSIVGYYGLPYFNLGYGDIQMILRTDRQKNTDKLESVGLDSHASGSAVWEIALHEMNINCKDSDKLSRRAAVKRLNGEGMAIINLVNADVIPSFLENDKIKVQVIALPEEIEYFADEDAYAVEQPMMSDGNRLLLADGSVFPSGLLSNRSPDSSAFESDDHLDDIMNIRATVKTLYHGCFQLDGESHNTFIRCCIDTNFGPLEIVHSRDQVKPEQRKNIRPGAIVNFYGVLSGDAAIYEYEHGIVRDEDHDLAALRYVFCGGDAERLREILSADAIYHAEYNQITCCGPDEIIKRLNVVQSDQQEPYFAHMATITSVDSGEQELPYAAGKRCVILASGEKTHYISIAFIDLNKEGNIVRISTTSNSRYHFQIDKEL